MLEALVQLFLFFAKAIIVLCIVTGIFIAFFSLLIKSKEKSRNRLVIKNLSKIYDETTKTILAETLSKKAFKKFLKKEKSKKQDDPSKRLYVLHFNGDIKASAVSSLREEITAVLSVATPQDEVIIRLDSAGGIVHGYGLAAAQLMRLRAQCIPLTVCIDKIAASGGYLMACVANKIISAPFAIVGSIGVIVQLPNFHRLLKDKHIDFEQLTAGEFKRTITVFGENTSEGRKKLQQDIEDIHRLFKNLIAEHRPQVDIQKVATGEHWMGQEALELNLVDDIKTSDAYLLERSKEATIYQISYEIKKSFWGKLSASASRIRENMLGF